MSLCLLLVFVVIEVSIILCEKTKHGLIIVDIQYDFADPSGSLTVFGNNGYNDYLNISSSEYISRINDYLLNEKDRFDFIVYSIDYHPPQHCSFASTMQSLGADVNAFEAIDPSESSNINKEWSDDICVSQTGYQVLWPDHCIIGSDGAKFMSSLYDIRPLPHLQSQEDLRRVIVWRDSFREELYVTNYKLSSSYIMSRNLSFKSEIDHVLSDIDANNQITANVSQIMYLFKGRDLNIDSYSVFDGNDGITRTGLFDALNAYDYTPSNTDLTIFGIAYDYCVVFTCRDAVDHGYHVTIMDQLTAPVFPNSTYKLKKEMADIGMTINYTYGKNHDEYIDDDDNNNNDDGEETTFSNELNIELGVIFVLIIIIVFLIVLMLWKRRNQPKVSIEADNNKTATTTTTKTTVNTSIDEFENEEKNPNDDPNAYDMAPLNSSDQLLN